MQTVNFSPLDFGGIRQQELDARRRQRQAYADMARGLGNMGQGAFNAKAQWDEQQRAEDWRKREWDNRRWQQEDERKWRQDELNRRLEEQRLNNESAAKLRQEFMGKYGNMDLGQYGLPAQFAMDRIRNARTWDEVVGGGNALAQAIQYQDMLRGQQEEQQRERFVPNFIKDYDTRLAYENRFNFDKPEQTAYGYSKEELGTRYSNLMGEKEDLEALIASDPRYKNPEVVRRLNALNDAITVMEDRILRIRHPERYQKHSRFSRG